MKLCGPTSVPNGPPLTSKKMSTTRGHRDKGGAKERRLEETELGEAGPNIACPCS